MLRVLIALGIILFSQTVAYGQETYYWYNDQKQALKKVDNKHYLLYKNKAEFKGFISSNAINVINRGKENLRSKIKPFETTKFKDNYWATVQVRNDANVNWNESGNIRYHASFYKVPSSTQDGKSLMGISQYF